MNGETSRVGGRCSRLHHLRGPRERGRDQRLPGQRPASECRRDRVVFALPYERMFAFIYGVQLALDSLDRLVDTLEERGPLTAVEAARALFATPSISDGLACSL